MQLARPAIAVDPRQFGRGPLRVLQPALRNASTIGADLKLFAATFLAGFVFVSVLIG
jgi:hypothetical protein